VIAIACGFSLNLIYLWFSTPGGPPVAIEVKPPVAVEEKPSQSQVGDAETCVETSRARKFSVVRKNFQFTKDLVSDKQISFYFLRHM
jgi:hypothetical protein